MSVRQGWALLGAQDVEEGAVPSTASSESGTSSPRGPKGGGTLKTCAVCIEDYRCAHCGCVALDTMFCCPASYGLPAAVHLSVLACAADCTYSRCLHARCIVSESLHAQCS